MDTKTKHDRQDEILKLMETKNKLIEKAHTQRYFNEEGEKATIELLYQCLDDLVEPCMDDWGLSEFDYVKSRERDIVIEGGLDEYSVFWEIWFEWCKERLKEIDKFPTGHDQRLRLGLPLGNHDEDN